MEQMEQQFILRVPPSVAARINRFLNENVASHDDNNIDLSFSEDGRSGTFKIGNDEFSASLLDLPGVVESYKSYDDSNLVKAADIGQIIMVKEKDEKAPKNHEHPHGLTPSMRNAREQRFRKVKPIDLEEVKKLENNVISIMTRGKAENDDHKMVQKAKNAEEEEAEDLEIEKPEEASASQDNKDDENAGSSSNDDNDDSYIS